MYRAQGGGANYGLERHERDFLTPSTQGVVVDPPDGVLPYQEWARAERVDRELPHRGYDDPTAHCFVAAGVPQARKVVFSNVAHLPNLEQPVEFNETLRSFFHENTL